MKHENFESLFQKIARIGSPHALESVHANPGSGGAPLGEAGGDDDRAVAADELPHVVHVLLELRHDDGRHRGGDLHRVRAPVVGGRGGGVVNIHHFLILLNLPCCLERFAHIMCGQA